MLSFFSHTRTAMPFSEFTDNDGQLASRPCRAGRVCVGSFGKGRLMRCWSHHHNRALNGVCDGKDWPWWWPGVTNVHVAAAFPRTLSTSPVHSQGRGLALQRHHINTRHMLPGRKPEVIWRSFGFEHFPWGGFGLSKHPRNAELFSVIKLCLSGLLTTNLPVLGGQLADT